MQILLFLNFFNNSSIEEPSTSKSTTQFSNLEIKQNTEKHIQTLKIKEALKQFASLNIRIKQICNPFGKIKTILPNKQGLVEKYKEMLADSVEFKEGKYVIKQKFSKIELSLFYFGCIADKESLTTQFEEVKTKVESIRSKLSDYEKSHEIAELDHILNLLSDLIMNLKSFLESSSNFLDDFLSTKTDLETLKKEFENEYSKIKENLNVFIAKCDKLSEKMPYYHIF